MFAFNSPRGLRLMRVRIPLRHSLFPGTGRRKDDDAPDNHHLGPSWSCATIRSGAARKSDQILECDPIDLKTVTSSCAMWTSAPPDCLSEVGRYVLWPELTRPDRDQQVAGLGERHLPRLDDHLSPPDQRGVQLERRRHVGPRPSHGPPVAPASRPTRALGSSCTWSRGPRGGRLQARQPWLGVQSDRAREAAPRPANGFGRSPTPNPQDVPPPTHRGERSPERRRRRSPVMERSEAAR